jgi:fibronectin-binding autotransporter adhesin
MTASCTRFALSVVLLALSVPMPSVAQSLLKTRTYLEASSSATVFGQDVIFTATVMPQGKWPAGTAPDGLVSFEDLTSGQVLGVVPVGEGGAATLVAGSLGAGMHHIRAAFLGSPSLGTSSMRIGVMVRPAPTTLALTSSDSPSTLGQPVTFTATVSASPSAVVPTGTVTFFDNGTAAATTTVNGNGDAIFTTSALTTGAHTIVASFASSTPNFVSSAPASIVQHVTRDVVVLGADVGSLVIVMDAHTNEEVFRFEAFAGFRGGVSVAAGDVNGDSVPDIIVATGPGGGSTVAVFDGVTRAAIRTFFAFPGFSGGVSVAAGDVNGDGLADIIVGVGVNGHVKVFSGQNNALLASFFAFPGFTGGVSVAAGDLTGDGFSDLIVVAAANGHVKVFDGATNTLLRSFLAYPTFTGGVNVAAGDVNGDGKVDILTGAASVSTHVKAFDGATLALLHSFFAYTGATSGVRVGSVDRNGDGADDILTTLAAPGGHVKVFDGLSLAILDSFFAADLPAGAGLFITGSR